MGSTVRPSPRRRSWGRRPLWSFVPSGSRDHIDFGEQFPYNPEKARALLKEAGYDEKHPLRYTIMTHGAEAALPTIATIIKTQLAKIGVEVTVDVIDRPIFLRRLTTDRDWDQSVNLAAAAGPLYDLMGDGYPAGINVVNHADKHMDALIDRLKEAPTEETFRQAGKTFNAMWQRT